MSESNADAQAIGKLPLAILDTIPAGTPPPGVQPDYLHPQSLVPALLGVSTVFLVVAIVCFIIRIYMKLAVVKNWRWDDVACSLGFACAIVYFAVVFNGCVNGGTGRHTWDLYLGKVLNNASLYQDYITTIMATPALGLIKCSLFIQYYCLFRPLRWLRIVVWIGATISTTFYMAVSITAFVLESPWPGESLVDDVESSHYLHFAALSIPTGVIGMLVDWYLLILPIPAVMTLQMPIKKKLGILIIFMAGGLAAIASLVSLYYRVQLQRGFTDPSWRVTYVLLWTMIEMFVGVAVSSMPTVFQFFIRHDFSVTFFTSSLRSGLKHLRSNSKRQYTFDSRSASHAKTGGILNTPESLREFRMQDLESNNDEGGLYKAPARGTSDSLDTATLP